MFRQRIYKQNENNILKDRLNYLYENDISYDEVKCYDIDNNCWIVNEDSDDYKIQKEITTDNTLIFYVYSNKYIKGG